MANPTLVDGQATAGILLHHEERLVTCVRADERDGLPRADPVVPFPAVFRHQSGREASPYCHEKACETRALFVHARQPNRIP